MNRMHVLGMALTTLLTGASIAAVGCTTTTNVTDDPGDAASDAKKPRDSGVPVDDGGGTCTPGDKTGFTPPAAIPANRPEAKTQACSQTEIDAAIKAFNGTLDDAQAWVTNVWTPNKATTCNKCLATEDPAVGGGAAITIAADGPKFNQMGCLDLFQAGCSTGYNGLTSCIEFVCQAPACQDQGEASKECGDLAAPASGTAVCTPELNAARTKCSKGFQAGANDACFPADAADDGFVGRFLHAFCAPVADGG